MSANILALIAAFRAKLRESTIFKYALLASSAIFASCLIGLKSLINLIINYLVDKKKLHNILYINNIILIIFLLCIFLSSL